MLLDPNIEVVEDHLLKAICWCGTQHREESQKWNSAIVGKPEKSGIPREKAKS